LFYAPSWSNILSVENRKQENRTELARPGEGKNSQQVRSKNRQNRLKQRSKNIKQTIEEKRVLQKNLGLNLCDAICEQSGAYCRKKCLTKKGLEEHMRKGGHNFPSTNARDFLIRQAGKAGGALANGSRPDRRSNTLFEEIVPSFQDSPSEVAAQCYQRFNRCDRIDTQHKTDAQICFLLCQFGLKDKQNPKQQTNTMKKEIDDVDGGLKFGSAKADLQTNGRVLSEEQITSWISIEVKNREEGKISGESRKNSIAKHLKTFENLKVKNPLTYWKIYDDQGKCNAKTPTLNSMLYLFDISLSNLKVAEKRQKLEDLNVDKAGVDAKIEQLQHRIDMLKFAIEASKGRNEEAERYHQQLLEESNQVLALESARLLHVDDHHE
jgi:hypothetical protein